MSVGTQIFVKVMNGQTNLFSLPPPLPPFFPLKNISVELVDKCIGSRLHIVMKSDKEIVGTLLGFDDFVSILLKGGCMGFSSVFFKKNYRLSILTGYYNKN